MAKQTLSLLSENESGDGQCQRAGGVYGGVGRREGCKNPLHGSCRVRGVNLKPSDSECSWAQIVLTAVKD